MEDLTRPQFILLVLLVTFVTSVFTGIVTATLVTQAPSPITQTVSKVIEKTIETVSPGSTGNVNIGQANVLSAVSQEDLVVNLVEKYSPAVVSVVATKDIPVIEKYFINPYSFFPEIQVPQYRQNGTEAVEVSTATGFFVSNDGYLLTNKHVVADKDARYSIILKNGDKLSVDVLARDQYQDIAILKVVLPASPADRPEEDKDKKFNYIPFANSDKIKAGQTVVAIGNTLGKFQNSVSVGIISGLNREIAAQSSTGEIVPLQKIIQTDSAINHGNSGGPLLNLNGQVVGINTAVAQEAENVGFALPINITKKNLADVREFGEVRFAYLGVRYNLVEEGEGVVLERGMDGQSAIMKDSPAEKAGLKEGDIVLEFNGKKLNKDNILSELINNSRVGQEIPIKILRDGEEVNVAIKLDERPKNL